MFSSVQSLSRVWLFAFHGPQNTRPPCPSPTPRVYPNSCTFSRWCHPTISSSVVPFSSCLQSFPASGSFLSQLFPLGGQSMGGASASVLPMNIQGWFPCCPRDSQESSPAPQFASTSSLALSFLYSPTLSSIHDYWKNHSFDNTFVSKVISLLFNTLSRFVIAFPASSKPLLISWYVYRYIYVYTVSESD